MTYPRVSTTVVMAGVPIPQRYSCVRLSLGRSWEHPPAAAAAALLLKARLMREVATHPAAAAALGVTLGSEGRQQLLGEADRFVERSKVVLELLPEPDCCLSLQGCCLRGTAAADLLGFFHCSE